MQNNRALYLLSVNGALVCAHALVRRAVELYTALSGRRWALEGFQERLDLFRAGLHSERERAGVHDPQRGLLQPPPTSYPTELALTAPSFLFMSVQLSTWPLAISDS